MKKKILMFLLAAVMVIPHGTYLAAEEFTSGDFTSGEETQALSVEVPESVEMPESIEIPELMVTPVPYDMPVESIVTPVPENESALEDDFTDDGGVESVLGEIDETLDAAEAHDELTETVPEFGEGMNTEGIEEVGASEVAVDGPGFSVTGLENPLVFSPGRSYPFIVTGAGMENKDPAVGDIRWNPCGWATSTTGTIMGTDPANYTEIEIGHRGIFHLV